MDLKLAYPCKKGSDASFFLHNSHCAKILNFDEFWVIKFLRDDYKIVKNPHTQWKSFYFVKRHIAAPSKIGHQFRK